MATNRMWAAVWPDGAMETARSREELQQTLDEEPDAVLVVYVDGEWRDVDDAMNDQGA